MLESKRHGGKYNRALVFKIPHLSTKYQHYGGSQIITVERRRKRVNGDVDFIPEGFGDQELLPGITNVIVAEGIWPKIREDLNRLQVENMLRLRLVSKLWLAFIDDSEFMDKQQMQKYNKFGPVGFQAAPGRFRYFTTRHI